MISLCLAVQAHDFERIMSMCDGLCDELDDFRKHLEVETPVLDYQQFLLFTLSGVKCYKPRKTKMVDGEHICEENDDSDEASDPRYKLFFESFNKYEKSYVVQGKIIDVFVSAKYEGDSKCGCKRKPKCARKLSKDNGRVDSAVDQSSRLPNDQAPVNQHVSDNVNYKRNEISKKKPDLRNKEIIKESEVGFFKALSKKMDNLRSCKVSKNMTVVHEDIIVTDNQSEPHGQTPLRKADKGEDVDKAPVDQHAYDHVEDNTVTDNQSEPHGQARLKKAGKEVHVDKAHVNQHASDHVDNRRNEISKKKPDLRNKGIIKESDFGFSKAVSKKMDNLGRCKLSKNMYVVQEDNIVTYSQSETHVQARLRKAGNRDDMDKAHYVPECESVIRISYDGNRYQSPDPKNNSESKNKSDPVGQVQPIKREKGLKGKSVVLSKKKPDTEKNAYLKSDPKHNLTTKYQSVRANQVVPSEEDREIQRKTNMPRVKKEKNVVTDNCVDNRRGAVNYRDNEPLYPKPSPEKNLEECQYEDANLAQPGKKHMGQRPRKLRKVVHGSHDIKVDDAASRTGMAHIENILLFHKPCPRKNQVPKNCIDQARPKQSHCMLMKKRVITDDSDSDVEILDSASFYRAGNPGPFVTSKKFHKSMMEDDSIKLLGRTSSRFDFKKQVMNVLRKPYDKQESNRLREAFMAGSYVKFHPDLVKKLSTHRCEKRKCLAILRGFFFWLENLTKQGSFKPWKDIECLGVDPTLL